MKYDHKEVVYDTRRGVAQITFIYSLSMALEMQTWRPTVPILNDGRRHYDVYAATA